MPDTGLPRYYVRAGNEALVEGGFVALERALRPATADATAAIPLRLNRVHPLTRVDHDNNVGIHAPKITYAFEPGGDWIDITTVHKGGLFGSDYRMLFPADGIAASSASSSTRSCSSASAAWRASPRSSASAGRRTRACASARKRRACAPSAAAIRIRRSRREDELTAPLWFTDYYRRGIE